MFHGPKILLISPLYVHGWEYGPYCVYISWDIQAKKAHYQSVESWIALNECGEICVNGKCRKLKHIDTGVHTTNNHNLGNENSQRHMKVADTKKKKKTVALRIVIFKLLSSRTMSYERNYFVKQFLLYLSLL